MRGDDHAGGLALDQILPAGLAGDRLGAEHPQQVVAQLECLADRCAVAAQAGDRAVAAAAHRRADLQRAAHRVVARFAPRHLQHRVHRRQVADIACKISELTECQLGAHGVVTRPGLLQTAMVDAAFTQHLFGPDQTEIAEQDRRRFAESLRRPGQLPIRGAIG